MADTVNKFIGSGMIFPIELDNSGKPPIYNNIKLIRSSIINILSWPKRTRFFNEHFGSRIGEVIEEPNDNISNSLIIHFVTDALQTWEKRIELVSLDIDDEKPGVVFLKIVYRIRETKIDDSFIFPFYKQIIY